MCMVFVVQQEQNTAVPTTLHKVRHGELKSELKKIASELELEDGETVHSDRVLWITNELRRRGLDVNFGTVRTKLRSLGYYTETNR